MTNSRAPQSRLLLALGGVFIFFYHLFFTFDGFNTVFGGDDGMNLFHLHHYWDRTAWASILDALQVITPAYRPVGGLFYRLLYQSFGFDPLAFRIVLFSILTLNIWFVYTLARKLDASRAASALACLLFSYNAGLMDFEYNTGTLYDVLCFLFYFPALIIYISRRSTGKALHFADIALIVVLYGAALDSKELAVTLPAAFLLYEILYRLPDVRIRPVLLRQSLFLAILFGLTVLYARIKVADMSVNDLYRPRPSVSFALRSIGHFLELFLYRNPDSYTVAGVILTVALLLGISVMLSSRPAIFGTLFFFGALVPVALIPHRGGFAAYIAFPGLTLAAGCIIDGARIRLLQASNSQRFQQSSSIVLFLLVAIFAGKYHLRVRNRWLDHMHSDQHRLAEVMDLMKQRVPDFPNGFRILLTEDAFPPHDWVIFFLTQMRYADPTVWLDRPRNLDQPPDLASYDLLMNYQPSQIESAPVRILGFRLKWEPRAHVIVDPSFTVSSGRSDATEHAVTFSQSAVGSGQSVILTIPGLGGTKIDVVYRLIINGREQVFRPVGWCSLDASSSCAITAPPVNHSATLVLDWVRPQSGKWERVVGSLQITQ